MIYRSRKNKDANDTISWSFTTSKVDNGLEVCTRHPGKLKRLEHNHGNGWNVDVPFSLR